MKTNSISRASLAIALFLVFIGSAFAQNNDGVNRFEFFGGYSHNRVDTGIENDDFGDEFNSSFGDRLGANGVNVQFTGNFSKYFGAKFDFAANGANKDVSFDGSDFDLRYRSQTYMGGVQIKNNAKEGPRFKPFAHVLAGVAHQSLRISSPDFEGDDLSVSDDSFTMAFGGGLDIKASKNVDVRVFQFDYNPIFLRGRNFGEFETGSITQHNYRFGFGIVIH